MFWNKDGPLKTQVPLCVITVLLLISFFNMPKVFASSHISKEKDVFIYMSDTCMDCQKLKTKLDKEKLPYKEKNIKDPKVKEELISLCKDNKIKPVIPILRIDNQLYRDNIADIVKKAYKGEIAGIKPIKKTDKRLLLLPVILGGFLDGFNPCAISMLLFFLSILIKENETTMLKIGLSYILGVFFIYFFIGVGFGRILEKLINDKTFIGIVYIFSFLTILYVFFLDLRDYIYIRQGKVEKIKNELSKSQKDKIHQLLRKSSKKNAGLSFFVGALVGIMEFSCTGQMYIPTISYIQSSLGGNLYVYLLAYNILFVLPMLILLFVFYKTKSLIDVSLFMFENREKVTLMTLIFYSSLLVYFASKILTL